MLKTEDCIIENTKGVKIITAIPKIKVMFVQNKQKEERLRLPSTFNFKRRDPPHYH